MVNEIDQFLQYLECEKNSSPMTIESYNDDLLQFYKFLMGRDIDKNLDFFVHKFDSSSKNRFAHSPKRHPTFVFV